jgi:hypothetical protein
MLICSAVDKTSFLFDIWRFQFIIEDLELPNGNPLRKDYRNDSVVGKEIAILRREICTH